MEEGKLKKIEIKNKSLTLYYMRLLIYLFFAILLYSNTLSAYWPMFMGNHYLTGNNDEIVPDDKSLNWYKEFPSYIFYPVPYKDTIIVGCLDKNIYAVNRLTGNIIWELKLHSPAIKSTANYKNYLLVTAGDFIYVIDIYSGRIIWSRKEGISVQLSTPIVIDDIVYYGSRIFFYARYIRNGHLLWKNDSVKIYGGSPIYWNERIYFLTKDYSINASILNCLSATNGKILWQHNIPSDANIFTPVVFNKKVFIPSNNTLYAFDAKNGKLLWEKKLDTNICYHPVFANNSLLISANDGNIYVISPKDGTIINSFPNFNSTGASFIIVGETLFIPNNNGDIYSYNYETSKTNWKFQTEITNRRAFLSAQDGRLYIAIANRLYSVSPGIVSPTPIVASSQDIKEIDITLKDDKGNPLQGDINVNQNGKDTSYTVNGTKSIQIEKNKEAIITATAKDFFVNSIKIKPKEKKKSIDITLNKIKPNERYIFHNINFKYNSAEITGDSIPTLNGIIEFLTDNENIKIEIRGYTDNIGGKELNLKLSQRRAEKVKEFLIKNGISSNRLQAKGFGEADPIAPNETEQGREQNRRTEFVIIK